MEYKYNIGDIVNIQRTISGKAEVIKRLQPENQEINLYQLKVLDGNHQGKLLWFAEHEITQ